MNLPTGAFDALNPHPETPTPLMDVYRLTRPQREQRVERLTEISRARLAEAVTTHGRGKQIVYSGLLVSGGKDSWTIAHLFRDVATCIVHANTGTGIEATRQFVRDTAAAWGMPMYEGHPKPGEGYFDLVLGNVRNHRGEVVWKGFPGAGGHSLMYQRLKERGLDDVRHQMGISRRKYLRAVWIAGRRRAESKTRETVPWHEADGTVIWSSPLVLWHKGDLLAYRMMHAGTDSPVPVNPVAEALGMSGECGCLSNAAPGEPQRWFEQYPDDPFLQRVLEVQEQIKDRPDIPEHRKRWGWNAASREESNRRAEAAGRGGGRLCGADCGPDPLLDMADPMSSTYAGPRPRRRPFLEVA